MKLIHRIQFFYLIEEFLIQFKNNSLIQEYTDIYIVQVSGVNFNST